MQGVPDTEADIGSSESALSRRRERARLELVIGQAEVRVVARGFMVTVLSRIDGAGRAPAGRPHGLDQKSVSR